MPKNQSSKLNDFSSPSIDIMWTENYIFCYFSWEERCCSTIFSQSSKFGLYCAFIPEILYAWSNTFGLMKNQKSLKPKAKFNTPISTLGLGTIPSKTSYKESIQNWQKLVSKISNMILNPKKLDSYLMKVSF